MRPLYRGFTTRAEIDAQYDVDRQVPDYGVYARHYAEASRLARRRLHHELDVAYGSTRAETLDIFPADRAGAPVFVFFHGGYWRSLSSKDFSCVAVGLHSLGMTPVVATWGGRESEEFCRQSEDYLAAWQQAGNRGERLSQAGRHHFDAIVGFENPDSDLCRWTCAAATHGSAASAGPVPPTGQ